MAKVFTGTGHRKSSIARVRMVSGKGKITINGRDVNEYLPFKTLVMDLMQPLEITKTADKTMKITYIIQETEPEAVVP